MKFDKKSMLIYAITDRTWLNGKTLGSQVEKALIGGATFIQLREKNLDNEKFLQEAHEIKRLCQKYNVPFVINDNVRIAKEIDADGVHVGQSDMAAVDVRSILGKDKIIGVSAGSVEEALAAQSMGADYIGAGAIFPTGSKSDAGVIGVDTLKAICKAVDIPVVAIGGLNEATIPLISGSGADGVAVISAVFAQKDITTATERLAVYVKEVLCNET
ncbi:MAG: thiamine phosphate synthase [Lachnospiraceae bacterium]|nr:thiamine phosphate synthase [Lachnospiraceae bacterium]